MDRSTATRLTESGRTTTGTAVPPRPDADNDGWSKTNV
jgi:hypothetical protein